MLYESEKEFSLALRNTLQKYENLTGKEASEMTYMRTRTSARDLNHSAHRSPRSGVIGRGGFTS
jgi:hypothetical protein